MQLKVKSALLCDLVRIENTGKHILIGVYAGEVHARRRPFKFAPTFWLEVVPPVRGEEVELEIKLDAPGQKKSRRGIAKATVAEEDTIIISFTSPPLDIAEAGILKLSMRLKGGRWRQILAKRVEFADLPSPVG
jgi:hypothetical protein